jgi:hypothetical protein
MNGMDTVSFPVCSSSDFESPPNLKLLMSGKVDTAPGREHSQAHGSHVARTPLALDGVDTPRVLDRRASYVTGRSQIA